MPQTSRIMPDQARLRECFDYDPETGIVTRRLTGRVCRTPGTRGYLRARIDGQAWLLHRLIWKWMTGEDPETVDHENHQTDDNRWKNLRAATWTENTRHCRGHGDRKYPGALKGAYRHKAGWLAMIGYRGKQHYLGCFRTEQEAHEAYCEAAVLFHGEFRKSN